jgi:uncharacterized protein YecE (DUF72 family)
VSSFPPAPDVPFVRIGCAGWSIPRAEQPHFPPEGSHLERYAARFSAVEINSSFHRSHRTTTWEKWRDSVPEEFRFSVKLPKTITHLARLEGTGNLLATFLREAGALGKKLGCPLVQLPPSLAFDPEVSGAFFDELRGLSAIDIACEPRHESWFAPEADALLARFRVARVAADPARVPAAAEPGGWKEFRYFRLHGSPKIYYSAYSAEFIANLALELEQKNAPPAWCIFDNTTLGAATRNALDLCGQLQQKRAASPQQTG